MDKTLGSPVEKVDSGMSGVIYLLLDIPSWLQATDHFMKKVKSDRAAEVAWRQEIPSYS